MCARERGNTAVNVLADEAQGFDQLGNARSCVLKQQIVAILNGKIVQVRKRNGRDRKSLTQILKRRGKAEKIVRQLKRG